MFVAVPRIFDWAVRITENIKIATYGLQYLYYEESFEASYSQSFFTLLTIRRLNFEFAFEKTQGLL